MNNHNFYTNQRCGKTEVLIMQNKETEKILKSLGLSVKNVLTDEQNYQTSLLYRDQELFTEKNISAPLNLLDYAISRIKSLLLIVRYPTQDAESYENLQAKYDRPKKLFLDRRNKKIDNEMIKLLKDNESLKKYIKIKSFSVLLYKALQELEIFKNNQNKSRNFQQETLINCERKNDLKNQENNEIEMD